ncbi:MAG: hypothetical protein CMO98_03260 [Woeseia sp.]|nr:hypothetical protein [Woeseia sp.]|tara:strand:- start:4264 stop:6312 length:2049 start_codon:yes stop_codon:yes gene_type:complete
MTYLKRLAVDVGGTFIDFVMFDPMSGEVSIEKVRSAGELSEQFFEGTNKLGVETAELGMIAHGSTMVINTIVQENGARVGLITTEGFRDVLELGRGSREDIYDLFYKPPPPLVPRSLRFEVPERLDSKGSIVKALDESATLDALQALKDAEVDSIAVCFLHSYVNPVHEKRVTEIAREAFPDAAVSISSDVVREWREFERTNTTVLNSYTRPKMEHYLSGLESELKKRQYKGDFTVMQSSGGITSTEIARRVPVRTIQSGPAGGVIGACRLSQELDLKNMVVADVGGTTFDVSLITDGHYVESSSAKFNRRPVLQPTIDIVSVGAGGGSIAWLDKEGGLQVGPESAQADPGPACFGLGGTEPTVTDAQLVLGYLDPETYLGKRIELDVDAAQCAIAKNVAEPLGLSLQKAAAGIVHITSMNMAYSVRQITVERGHDPREFSLVCIGGGGGLFAGALIKELEMRQAIVPQHPAVFSAWGLLNADYREDVSFSFIKPMNDVTGEDLRSIFRTMEEEARKRLGMHTSCDEGLDFECYAEMRYLGQEHTVKIPVKDADYSSLKMVTLRNRFDKYYEKAYAHALPDHALEFVILRLVAVGVLDKPRLSPVDKGSIQSEFADPSDRLVYEADQNSFIACPVYNRDYLLPKTDIAGPAIVEEWSTTVLVLADQKLRNDEYGSLIIRNVE